MASLIKKVKVMQQNGTFTDYIPIGAEAENINIDGESVEAKLGKKPYYYDTVADMKADTKLKTGDMVITLGYYNVNDGGGAEYKIKNTTNEYSETLTNNLKAELIIKNNELNVLCFGAKGDNNFDNTQIFKSLFYSGKSNIKIIIPNGIYNTYSWGAVGNQSRASNIELIGINKPTINLIPTYSTKTLQGTYSDTFTVEKGLYKITTESHFSLDTLQLADGRYVYYLKCDDKTLLPSDLGREYWLVGNTSNIGYRIASLDKDDPDGEGTARIYLYDGAPGDKRVITYNNTNNVLTEDLWISNFASNYAHAYIHLQDKINIPEYFLTNSHIYQESSNKNARIASIVTFNGEKFIRLNCVNDKYYNSPFSKEKVLNDNETLQIYKYTGVSGTLCSLNKMTNVIIRNIKFNGNSSLIGFQYSDGNGYNMIYLGGTKNITIEDCVFGNTIMSGLHIGGSGNAYSESIHDYPEKVYINNCLFYNNGRNDAEVIYGREITITNCNGDGCLDIEANGAEILHNINISNCTFGSSTPYRPVKSANLSTINYSNCSFGTFICQRGLDVKLTNVKIHSLRPYQECIIKGTNCQIDRIDQTYGNEHLFFTNSLFLGLAIGQPGASFGSSEWHFNQCVIDLSLLRTSSLYNNKDFCLNNSIFTCNVPISLSDVKSIYHWTNSIIHNIRLNGNSIVNGSIFENCTFTATDNYSFTSGSFAGVFKRCYIKRDMRTNYGRLNFYDCMLGATEQPCIGEQVYGSYIDGLKTDNGSYINWNWAHCGGSNGKLIFKNVEYDPASTNLGIKAGQQAVSVNTVSDESFFIYGNNENHYTRGAIKYVDNALTIDKY